MVKEYGESSRGANFMWRSGGDKGGAFGTTRGFENPFLASVYQKNDVFFCGVQGIEAVNDANERLRQTTIENKDQDQV